MEYFTKSTTSHPPFLFNLAENGVLFAFGENATFNLVNAYGVGLLELSMSKGGISSRLGMGGTDISFQNLRNVAAGYKEASKVTDWKYGSTETRSTLNSINMLGYTTILDNHDLAKDIWSKKLVVEYGNTGNDYGNYTLGENKIVLNKNLLGGGREASAKLATVMSHEGTHYNGNRVEAIAHLFGLETYSQINQTISSLQEDSSFRSEMLRAIFNPESWKENTGDVDHWKITQKDDGSFGWSWDGDFNFNIGTISSLTPEEMKNYIEKMKKIQSGEIIMHSGDVTKVDLFMNTISHLIAGSTDDFFDFLSESEHFVDASIAGKKLANGDLSQENINAMNAGLYAAQESGLLVKNEYSAIMSNGLVGSGTIDNPYLPLTGNVLVTCLAGYRFVTEDFYNSLKKDSRKNFPLNEFAENIHLHTDIISDNFNIVTSVEGAVKLNYDDTWGLNGTNYSSDGYMAFLSNHMDPSSIKNYVALFGMEGTNINQANNGSYYLNGIKAGSVYGQMGQTGISGGKHVDFGIYQTKNPYRLSLDNDTRIDFESIFNFDSYNIKYQDDWVQNFSGKPTDNIFDNYPSINNYLFNWTIKNVPNYSTLPYRG